MKHNSPFRSPLSRTLVVVGAVLATFACFARLDGSHDTPPQGWWGERGPVVPHDGFPADCTLCHEGNDWHTIREDFSFDHAAETGVPLEGAHAGAECLRCHNDRGPVSVFAARGCGGCHEDVHLGQLGNDCSSCHEEWDWRPRAEIVRHERTRFPLLGAHAAVPCWRCHRGAEVGQFTPVDVECLSCHAADFARATNPDHSAFLDVEACERCHLPTTWGGAGFIHGNWPLTGAHRGLACDACHVGGVFAGTPRDCFACHSDDFNGANDPDHVAGGFPTDCQLCHGTSSWEGATFDHSWVGGACVDCHLDDYNATTDPNHGAAGFPTTCDACHVTTTWYGATFDHDFPIQSGRHSGFNCIDCHLDPGNFSTFSCIDCHEHNQSAMDSEHDDVQDYVWESNACYSCHPDGRD